LTFLDDLTIPDGTEVSPGEEVAKRWLIHNEGTCNWNLSYSLQLISGLSLGVGKEIALYPARQSSEAVIEIIFTAPSNPGNYNSWWQAYDPDGNRFGDPIFMEISVVDD
jgi:next-to-BRCA1 protein 1